jgi:hypothetical protein
MMMVSTPQLMRGTYPQNPPPSPPPLIPNHPKQRDHNNNAMKMRKMVTQLHADTLHDPGGKTDSPGSVRLSIQLEGERNRVTSQHDKPNDIEMVYHDHDNHKTSRGPVGTPDGDTCCPNEPTESPNEEEGAQRGKGKLRVKLRTELVKLMVENIKMKESRQGDQPRGRGGNENQSRGVEGKARGQSEDNGC